MSTARVWVAVAPAADAQAALLRLVRQVAGVAPDAPLRVAHACPACGSSAHGRPLVVGAPVHASIARERRRSLAVVAVSTAVAVGIDVERADAVDFDGFDHLVLHPAERAPDEQARTRVWVGKEAVLKCRGTGLATDPASVLLARVPEHLVDVDLGPGWCCRIALAGAARVHLVQLD